MAPPSDPPKLLIYGHDRVLRDTRKLLLEQVGLNVTLLGNGIDLNAEAERLGFDLIVLCHTVPLKEQRLIPESTALIGTPLYQLTPLVEPSVFIRRVLALLELKQSAPHRNVC